MSIELATLRAPRDVDPEAVAPPIEAVPLSRHAATGTAISYSESFAMHTRGEAPAFFDVTDLIRGVARRSGVGHGYLLAMSAHTTCALIVQENEPLLLADLSDRLRRFAPLEETYRHNEMDIRTVNVCGLDECANGHSHCQHALLGAEISLMVRDGEIILGRWQRVLLVELDHPRPRQVAVQVTGVAISPNGFDVEPAAR